MLIIFDINILNSFQMIFFIVFWICQIWIILSISMKSFCTNKAIWYTPDNLYAILTTLTKETIAGKDWNAYSLFTPEKVMSIFKRIFIDNK